MAVLAAWSDRATAAEIATPSWDEAPYRVRVVLAAEGVGQYDEEESLIDKVGRRLRSAIEPLWQMNVIAPPSIESRRDVMNLDRFFGKAPSPPFDEFDKTIFVAVRASAEGFALHSREFDATLRRWGPHLALEVRQRSFLAESVVQLVARTASPLALVRVDAGALDRAALRFRGAKLPRRIGQPAAARGGQALLPMVVRTDARGRRVDQPATAIPWTFIVVEESPAAKDKELVHGRIVSGQRGALGQRRRGTTEVLAIALPNKREEVQVRFHARRDANQPLAGVEAFRLGGDGAAPERLGVSDAEGRLVIPLKAEATTMLLIRSGNLLLAKAPVAAGVADVIDIPLADDMVRVRAQGAVDGIREELVDLVARRAIYMARIRGALKRKQIDQARRLMQELSDLPLATSFARRIDLAEERAGKSPDSAVDAAIRRQFAEVRSLLAKFLDTRPISELQYQVNTARAESDDESPPSASEPSATDAT